MDKEFHSGIEFIRSINVGTDKDPEYIWITSHRKFPFLIAKGKSSVEAVNQLEKLIQIMRALPIRVLNQLYKPYRGNSEEDKSWKTKQPIVCGDLKEVRKRLPKNKKSKGLVFC